MPTGYHLSRSDEVFAEHSYLLRRTKIAWRGTRGPVASGRKRRSLATYLRTQCKTERTDNFEDSVETGCALARECFVQAFAR